MKWEEVGHRAMVQHGSIWLQQLVLVLRMESASSEMGIETLVRVGGEAIIRGGVERIL